LNKLIENFWNPSHFDAKKKKDNTSTDIRTISLNTDTFEASSNSCSDRNSQNCS
jgi:hypothetical protein